MARLKGHYLSSGNHYFVTGLRVPTSAWPFLANDKIPKPRNFDLLSAFQSLLDNFEYLLYNFRGFFSPKPDFLDE